MQITADSIGVYTKVFSLSPYQNFDVIRQWSVQKCLMAGPSCLYGKHIMTYDIINITCNVMDEVWSQFSGRYLRWLNIIVT